MSVGDINHKIPITDKNIHLTNTIKNNVSIIKHGFAPILPNDATKFLNGIGTWTVPAGGGGISTIVLQVFTTSGTYTPTAGMKYCIAEGVGGGAGGGSASAGVNQGSCGGGGGAGGTGEIVLTAANIGSSQTVTIGAAGAGGAAGGNNSGGNGGSTSLGTLLVCGGGTGGASAAPGVTPTAAGGAGGTVTTATVKIPGQPGGNAASVNLSVTTLTISGAGGSCRFGWGGVSVLGTGAITGNPGTGFGSGGSGAICGPSSSPAGGAGTAGYIHIIEFI